MVGQHNRRPVDYAARKEYLERRFARAAKRIPLGEGAWHDTALIFPDGSPDRWKDILTGESLSSQKCFLAGRLSTVCLQMNESGPAQGGHSAP